MVMVNGSYGNASHIFANSSNVSETHAQERHAVSGSDFHRRAANEFSVEFVRMTVMTNAGFLVVQLALFSALLMFRCSSKIVAPRFERGPTDRAPRFLLGWALRAWKGHEELYAQDLDSAMVLRFCILGLKFSTAGTLLACGLLPLYAAERRDRAQGLNLFNLPRMDNEDCLWAVVVAAYVLVGLFFHFAADEWRNFIFYRKVHLQHLARGDCGAGPAQASRSILVESIPWEARAADGSGVRAFFARCFKATGVHSCILHPNTSELHGDPVARLQGAGQRKVEELRRALKLDSLGPAVAAILPLRGGCDECHLIAAAGGQSACSTCPSEVSVRRSSKLNPEQDVPDEQSKLRRGRAVLSVRCCRLCWMIACQVGRRAQQCLRLVGELTIGTTRSSQTAFVTFNTVSDRVIAEQLVLSNSGKWQARDAPEARDILWPNVARSLRQLRARRFVSELGVLVGLVFWSFFIGTLQAAASRFNKDIPEWWRSYPGARFLASYLPVLVLMILQWVLPYALWLGVVCYEKCKLKSRVARRVLRRNLIYQFATLYITVISASLDVEFDFWRLFNNAMDQTPSIMLRKLSEDVPPVAAYFISYVMARIGISLPMLLLCPLLSCGKPVYADFAYEAGNLGLILVLGLTYSVMAPVIMPVCMLYFALAFLVYCWLFRYAYTPEFDAGGAYWHELFNGAVIGLLFGTLSLAGMVGSYSEWYSGQFLALLALAALVMLLFGVSLFRFSAPSRFFSLEDACAADEVSGESISSTFTSDYYVDPVLKDAPQDARRDGDDNRGASPAVPPVSDASRSLQQKGVEEP